MASRTQRYHDWGKTSKAFSYALFAAGKHLTEIGKTDLTNVAREYLAELDAEWPRGSFKAKGTVVTNLFGGDKDHPWYTGQLHDSIAIRVADGNKTVSISYMPPSADGGPQHMSAEDGARYDNIIGADWAVRASRNAQYYFLPGVQVQFIVGVPYTDKVNESGRHLGFFDSLSNELTSKVFDYFTSGKLTKERLVVDVQGTKVRKIKAVH